MTTSITNDIIENLQDYMFTSDNLSRFIKHMIKINLNPSQSTVKIENNKINLKQGFKQEAKIFVKPISKKETIYKPKQKDSLFWCFYILKNGYSNYEMEINNQYFIVEKNEKFKYIDIIRKKKDILKLHNIKPFTELEDDLANKDRISVKTFFALCILENINVLLVDKRKIFELTCIDICIEHPVNVIHRNSKTYENYIELDVNNDILKNYRDTYYKMNSFDSKLKAMSSYKLHELIDLCKKLNINIDQNEDKKKKTKKDIYELLVLNY